MIANVARLPAEDGARVTVELDAGYLTLVFLNGLAAPILGRWGGQPPTAQVWDFVVPGESYMTVPIPGGSNAATLVVAYPGAVPAADVQAIIAASDCAWAPFVGPLA
jgi:hypothetical protein